MRNIWITVSYEGTNYAGFQRQPTRMTVQEMLENTLLQLTGKKTTIYFVARTDAGVHAYGQECTFYTESRIPGDRFVHAMNALLPRDIRVRQSREMDEDFSVRRRNFGKTYGYLLTESREASPFLVRTIWRTGKHNWPIGSGKKFRGVFDRNTKKILTFSDTQKGTKEGVIEEIDINDPRADEIMDPEQKEQLMEEIELLDGASAEFSQEEVSKGQLTPVFFGSALTNFGVETFLEHFLKMTTSPLPRTADCGSVDPMSDDFSAFVFKIQANMNKAHRDRIAFMRICSGKFDATKEVYHVQGDKKMRLLQPQQMMAESRHVVEEAYAGDIIGVFDPGIFSIGDTICAPGKKFAFEGIPTFAPEHFARVRQIDTMKRKQFVKGINQIAQEGAIQIFQEFNTGMEEIIVGVVGILQFDVLKYRLENEYNVDIRLETLPYEHIRWIANKETVKVDKIVGTSDMKKVTDLKGNPLLLFVNAWSVGMVEDRNPELVLTEFSK